jgi:hypothetical protein
VINSCGGQLESSEPEFTSTKSGRFLSWQGYSGRQNSCPILSEAMWKIWKIILTLNLIIIIQYILFQWWVVFPPHMVTFCSLQNVEGTRSFLYWWSSILGHTLLGKSLEAASQDLFADSLQVFCLPWQKTEGFWFSTAHLLLSDHHFRKICFLPSQDNSSNRKADLVTLF